MEGYKKVCFTLMDRFVVIDSVESFFNSVGLFRKYQNNRELPYHLYLHKMVYGLVNYFYNRETSEDLKEALMHLNDTLIKLLEDILLPKMRAIGHSIGKLDDCDYHTITPETIVSLIDAANLILDSEFESTQRMLMMHFCRLRTYGHPLAGLVIDKELNLVLDENICQYFFAAFFLDELLDMHNSMYFANGKSELPQIITGIRYCPYKFDKLQSILEKVLDDNPNIFAEIGRKVELEYEDRLYKDTYRIYGTQIYDESNEYQNDFISAVACIIYKQ